MIQLPYPYGQCDDSDPVPVSHCILKCKARETARHCGCHDFYMHNVEGDSGERKIIYIPIHRENNDFKN